MASTYRPSEAFDYCKSFIKGMNLETVLPFILSDIACIMWMAAPWRWTIGTITPITLAASTQTYAITSPPSDCLYLLYAYKVNSDGTGSVKEIAIDPVIASDTTVRGDVSRCSKASDNILVFPTPNADLPSSPTQSVIIYYKKTCPVIKESTANTPGVLVFDDEWFWVYREGVLWKAYLYADDERAGAATVGNDGRVQYSGQYGVFMAALDEMRKREKISLYDMRVSPFEKAGVDK